MMIRFLTLMCCCMLGLAFGCKAKQASPDAQNTIPAPPDVAAPPPAALKTQTGLASLVLKAGDGQVRPTLESRVTVHYTGWTTDGRSFDSSRARGVPSTFGVSQVIAGWTEALQRMVVGEKRRLWVPENLAYQGQSGMPSGMLVFDVELLSIEGKTVPKGKPRPFEGAPPNALPKVKVVPSDPTKAPSDVAAPPKTAIRTASGLASRILKVGSGTRHPNRDSLVTIEYAAWTTDGRLFDSSFQRGGPARLPVNRAIKGWIEAIQLMVVGEKRRFWIPEALAYVDQPGPKGMVVFDVTLLKIDEPKPAPAVPDTVSKPPKDAIQTPSGLYSKVLKAGVGTIKPTLQSVVRVHYTGWTTDGQMFDSSIVRDEPVILPLIRVIPGWSEGLQLMVQGERRRFWIPQNLAYNGQPGAPKGMLVFDVELLGIIEVNPDTDMSGKNDSKPAVNTSIKGTQDKFDPDQPPQGYVECHDRHCHLKDGKVRSYRAVMTKMGVTDIVVGKLENPGKAPEDVAAPPPKTERTKSGISHRLLFTHKRKKNVSPTLENVVVFHFSGWTQKGESFLSSTLTESPAELPLATMPSSGLIEALSILKIGEKRRFWIPSHLMGREKGMQVPEGDLTFDIELIDVKSMMDR